VPLPRWRPWRCGGCGRRVAVVTAASLLHIWERRSTLTRSRARATELMAPRVCARHQTSGPQRCVGFGSRRNVGDIRLLAVWLMAADCHQRSAWQRQPAGALLRLRASKHSSFTLPGLCSDTAPTAVARCQNNVQVLAAIHECTRYGTSPFTTHYQVYYVCTCR